MHIQTVKRIDPKIKNKIKAEYITGISRADLAEKHGISEKTISSWMESDAKDEKTNWSKLREQHKGKTGAKIVEATSSRQAKQSLDELEFADFGLSIVAKTLKRIDKKLESGEALEPTELAILSRVVTDGTKSISEMLKTKGLYTGKTEEKVKHSGQVQVIPIFGNDIKANVPSYTSNKEDN